MDVSFMPYFFCLAELFCMTKHVLVGVKPLSVRVTEYFIIIHFA